MASRSLTHQFISLRERAHPWGVSVDEIQIPVRPKAFFPSQTPIWIDILNSLETDIESLDQLADAVIPLYRSRVDHIFDDDPVMEKDIQGIEAQFKKLMKKCEISVKKIGTVEASTTRLSQQERTMRLNAMRAKAAKLEQIGNKVRKEQKVFTEKVERGDLDTNRRHHHSHSDVVDLNHFSHSDGLSEDQILQMDLIEKRSIDRHSKIIDLAQNVNDLVTMFDQLHTLVIDQGTILDRIDYNVNLSLDHVNKGTDTLDDTNRRYVPSGVGPSVKCVLVLILIIAILLVCLILKYSLR